MANGKYLIWSGLLLAAGGMLGVLFFFAPEQYPFYPRCLFHALTGLQCPGCGGLRAAHCLLHGEIGAAFRFNPMLVLLAPVLLVAGMVRLVERRTGRNLLRWFRQPFWLWLFLGIVVVFAIGRNLA